MFTPVFLPFSVAKFFRVCKAVLWLRLSFFLSVSIISQIEVNVKSQNRHDFFSLGRHSAYTCHVILLLEVSHSRNSRHSVPAQRRRRNNVRREARLVYYTRVCVCVWTTRVCMRVCMLYACVPYSVPSVCLRV